MGKRIQRLAHGSFGMMWQCNTLALLFLTLLPATFCEYTYEVSLRCLFVQNEFSLQSHHAEYGADGSTTNYFVRIFLNLCPDFDR